MSIIPTFNLLWIPNGIEPAAAAYKSAAQYQSFGDALHATSNPPDPTMLPWIKGDDLIFTPRHIRVLKTWMEQAKDR